MSKTDNLKNKIKKGDTPAREFINQFPTKEITDNNNESEGDNIISNEIKNNNKIKPTIINNSANNISVNSTTISNDNSKNDDNDNISDNNDIKSAIANILESEAPKKEYVGVYLDSDVHKALNKLCNKSKKKGIKSKVVNDILRSVLKEQGLL